MDGFFHSQLETSRKSPEPIANAFIDWRGRTFYDPNGVWFRTFLVNHREWWVVVRLWCRRIWGFLVQQAFCNPASPGLN